mgnify:CR=1 FL=1
MKDVPAKTMLDLAGKLLKVDPDTFGFPESSVEATSTADGCCGGDADPVLLTSGPPAAEAAGGCCGGSSDDAAETDAPSTAGSSSGCC